MNTFSKCLFGLLITAAVIVLTPSEEAQAKSYQRDGRFKELSYLRDRWNFVDTKQWYIKAPDKWVHFMGSYALTEVANHIVDQKLIAGVLSFGLGTLKELDDAYREGWSRRDLYMDLGGVVSSVVLPDDLRLLAYYDNDVLMFKFSLIIN